MLFGQVVAAGVDHDGPQILGQRANFPFQICTEACGTTHRQHRHRKLRLRILAIVLCISLMSAEVSNACAQSTGRDASPAA